MLTRCLAVLGFGAWLLAASVTAAQAHIVLTRVPEAAERPGLLPALRIQLAGLAEVTAGSPLQGNSRSERIDSALAAGAATGASASVWVEGPFARADGGSELVLYVVGSHRDRALFEVLRVPAGSGASGQAAVDRSLALKVRQVLWDLTRSQEVLATPALVTAETRARWTAGVLFKTSTGNVDAAAGLSLGAGLRIPDGHRLWEAGVRLAVLGPVHLGGKAGRMSLTELAPALELGMAWVEHALRVGLRAGAQARTTVAQGRTAQGSEGTRVVVTPAFSLGPMIDIRLDPTWALELAIDVELTPQRQRFMLNDKVVADSGQLRGVLRAALAWSP